MPNTSNVNILQSLRTILSGMVAEPGHDADILPLHHLVVWLRHDALGSHFELDRRCTLLLDLLQADVSVRLQVKAYLEQFLLERRYRYTVAELGILGNETFGQAMKNRLFQRLLPATVEDRTLRETLGLLFDKTNDHEWVQQIKIHHWQRLVGLLDWAQADLPAWVRVQQEMLEALELLAVRVASLGVESEFTRCLDAADRTTTPFVEQHLELRQVVAQAQQAMKQRASVERLADHLDVLLDQCMDYIRKAHGQARVQGTSVTLSLILIRLEQSISRMRQLLKLTGLLPCDSRLALSVEFFGALVREENRKHSLSDLWTSLTDKLAVRVTEHASKTGEKYATETPAEYWQMAKAAIGAGVIVGALSLIKAQMAAWHVPPLWEAILFSLNYGIGFVIIHLLHFTIATKQPAMTAARIAAALDSSNGRLTSIDRVVELVVQVARTQFVAIMGNMLLAFLSALLIALACTALFGHSPISLEKSEKMLLELNPVLSGAIPHAAIAGVFLFLAGIISGYYDNLSMYHRIPDRLRKVPWLRRLLGVARLNRLANYLVNNTGALAGNFLFGCMLGSAGFVGFLLGLPIDIRHITFSSANLAYAMEAQGFGLNPWEVAFYAGTAVAIGLTNLAVSFSLAFYTALKARGVRRREVVKLAGGLGRRFLKRPRDFFYPPRPQPVVDTAASIKPEQAD
ncbi:site-specific recombinase [Limnobacter humi]|uniref:Site-specific recombinase n=1 Tax=Limnobacter humi TaxID=1778671 RepID=A0ABT1WE16_9BURK|nr:site-specific recombinase [Limnobacter humi]MCQ8895118.1 site-specific recombinase [Limnobacter humi]